MSASLPIFWGIDGSKPKSFKRPQQRDYPNVSSKYKNNDSVSLVKLACEFSVRSYAETLLSVSVAGYVCLKFSLFSEDELNLDDRSKALLEEATTAALAPH